MVLGTSSFLNRQPDLVVTYAATTRQEAFDALERSLPDVAVVELSITGPFDFPFLTRLRARHPLLPLLAFAYHEEVIFARRALGAGANGYLMKEARPEELVHALRQILSGRIYLSRRVESRISLEKAAAARGLPGSLNGSLVNSLSTRELRVMQLLGDGFPRERIAHEIGGSREAIRSTCYRIRRKLGLETFDELSRFAAHWAYYEGDFS